MTPQFLAAERVVLQDLAAAFPRVLDSFERRHLLAWCRSTMHNPEHVARFMETWLAEPGRDVEYYKREGWARVASACGAYEVDFEVDSEVDSANP